jgi:hypothetical protein
MDINIATHTDFLIYASLQILLFFAAIYALFGAIKIVASWDYNSTRASQYALEKRSYLVMVIIMFIAVLKIFLFAFFAYVVDGLSNIIPGAMCAAGVVEDFTYSDLLLGVKLFILLFCGVWMVVNSYDLKAKNYPFMRFKNLLFLFLGGLIGIEFLFEILYFTSLSTQSPVSCCSDIYGVNATMGQIPFGMSVLLLLVLFYLSYFLTLLLALQKKSLLGFFANIFFLFISYYAVVHFFGTYIYQQPTHKCPFCMLQKEYYYVGYFLWGSLFLGVFSAVAAYFIRALTRTESPKLHKANIVFNTFFTLLNTYFTLSYYFINGVWL